MEILQLLVLVLDRMGTVKVLLHNHFRMTTLGAADFSQVMELRKLPSGDFPLVPEKYLREELLKFHVADSRVAGTPLPPASKLRPQSAPHDAAAVPGKLSIWRCAIGWTVHQFGKVTRQPGEGALGGDPAHVSLPPRHRWREDTTPWDFKTQMWGS